MPDDQAELFSEPRTCPDCGGTGWRFGADASDRRWCHCDAGLPDDPEARDRLLRRAASAILDRRKPKAAGGS